MLSSIDFLIDILIIIESPDEDVLRKIFEELGATVSWNDKTKTVIGKKGDRTVKVTVGQNKMYVNLNNLHNNKIRPMVFHKSDFYILKL